MAKVQTNISIDTDIMKKLRKILSKFGFDSPMAKTMSAIAEVEEMEKHLEKYKSFSSIDEVLGDLLN